MPWDHTFRCVRCCGRGKSQGIFLLLKGGCMADRTTKILLGIIAAALVWIAVQLTPTADATRQIQDVNIVQVGNHWVDRALPVVR
jgi:hypothetical protein